MLKVRIIPTLLYKPPTLVKGIGFDSWRRVGSVMQAVKVYNLREVDELIFLDISATLEGRRPGFSLIDEIADECFMPLTVGGGVTTIEDFRELLKVGADKVCFNTSAVENKTLVAQAAEEFGSQCIVVSIDVRRSQYGRYEVYTHSGNKPTGLDPIEFAELVESLGAGEILLTSIDFDGAMCGYDLPIIEKISEAVSIPVIASGGAGSYKHMLDVLTNTKASAIAAASIFHFTEQTPCEAKKSLKSKGQIVRYNL